MARAESSRTEGANMSSKTLSSLAVYPTSEVEHEGTTYRLARGPEGRILVLAGDARGFEGRWQGDVFTGPLSAANAALMRQRLPWLCPQPLGLKHSLGSGDRLGLATPGHLRAVARINREGSGRLPAVSPVASIPAQQSMRENARTGRSPQEVLDDAMWGIFQEGWREPWGADADHLKTTGDVDLCVAAGYTFYTIDPGDHVDGEAHSAPLEQLHEKVAALPWMDLDDSAGALAGRYLGRSYDVEGLALQLDETSLLRAAAKYGGAVAHTTRMFRHLAAAMGSRPFELEVSVDETDTPTSPLEHFYVAGELRRLEVRWVSLAPRYPGSFEKGVDFIGDLSDLDQKLAQHAAIARALGPYKLSIHSGSDKFSVYPLFSRHAGDLVHLKTAGTSYLEALRVVGAANPSLFRQILALGRERYEVDRATYHVSAEASRVPRPEDLADDELAGVLDTFDGRTVLHVTFGSALDRYGRQLLQILDAHEEEHYAVLEAHFVRHLEAFRS
jgi:tagaturonate epimerase